jgi:hypothetical protein
LNDLNHLNGLNHQCGFLSASVIREIFVQPLVPGGIDSSNRGELGIVALAAIYNRDYAQVHSGKVRVATEMIAHHYGALAVQFRQCAIDASRVDAGLIHGCIQLGHKTSFSIPAAQRPENRIAGAFLIGRTLCGTVHLNLPETHAAALNS